MKTVIMSPVNFLVTKSGHGRDNDFPELTINLYGTYHRNHKSNSPTIMTMGELSQSLVKQITNKHGRIF